MSTSEPRSTTLFLCGDVMTGRGVDQILPHPSDPILHERSVQDATRYVELAERESGSIPRNVDPDYVWGDALDILDRVSPDLRIVNLETAVTTSDEPWPNKAVHYRMNPKNVPCLTAAEIDCCVLSNNHVLDWGYHGLKETLQTLDTAGIQTVGAGQTIDDARRPAVFEASDRGRVLVFAAGSTSSGIPSQWAATEDRPGVFLIDESSSEDLARIRRLIDQFVHSDDLVVFSIHWGSNWGYNVPPAQRQFAHTLIDEAGVDLVHGHSSHHVKGLETHHDRLILYGCGDFLTDYEGIRGHERFRDDLGLMYVPSMAADRQALEDLKMYPTRIEKFQVTRAGPEETEWLADVLNREGPGRGSGVKQINNGVLTLRQD